MTRPNIQIDYLVREMTQEEYEAYLADQEEDAKRKTLRDAEELAKTQARESARAKLAAIGLTEEEIAALSNG
jgi:hypothetical protein